MSNELKILFLGDIVGRPGRNVVKHYLGDLFSSENHGYDFVIANVENASHGFGLTEKNHNELGEYGINCFTSGNHIWDKKDIYAFIDTSDRLIRPANYPEGTRGVGYRIFEVKGKKIAVVNLLGRTYMSPIDSPWEFIEKEIEKIKQEAQIVIVDFHAEATAEKICFAKFCAERGVSAVIGTHTHIQTADERIIKSYISSTDSDKLASTKSEGSPATIDTDNIKYSTAYITDAGFCGAYDSVIGMAYEASAKRLITNIPERFDVAEGTVLELNAVSLLFDADLGHAKSIERIKFIKDFSEGTT